MRNKIQQGNNTSKAAPYQLMLPLELEVKIESTITVYECHGCMDCPQKKLCTRAKGNRKIQVSKDFIALRNESLARITSDNGKLLRLN